MATKPPINRRLLQKEGLLDDEKFFADLALESGFSDVETSKRVYLAMVRVINRRLINRFVCRLPFLGDFAVPVGASRSALVGKTRMMIPPKRVLKFYPVERWIKHINTKLNSF